MLDPTPSSQRPGETPLLQTIGLTKRYGTFLANDSIDIDIWPEQIHALLGENGAGKSTLVKAIYGLIQPSAGEIRWQGEPIALSGPSEARARGIGMVFQHFSLFDNLTVAENVALGLDGKESFKDMSARLEQVSSVYGLPLDPKREVWQLSVGERQRIEIVRAVMQDSKFMILDEPTAVLTPQEADQLFIVLDRLKAEGRAILYISHKLEEVKRLCDTATIMRGGRKVATCSPQAETAASLARMMVGADIKEVKAATGRHVTVPRLVVNDLSLEPDDPHGVRLQHISLELKGGEILGIAGVAGNGQDEFFAALSGERLAQEPATIVIEGIAAGHLSITRRRKLGAAFVPEERLGHGTAPRMKLSENALLTGHAASGMVKHGFIDTAATLKTVDRATETFDVRKAKRDPEAASLSGGNLQKFVVGREILRNPAVLVVSQPTWGVDAGATAVIRQPLLDLAAAGAAVLVTGQDLDELAEIPGRIAVKTEGTDAGHWVLPAMLLAGAAAGALYALIPAICKVRFGASEILTSLMLVYVADLLLDYLVRGPWRDPGGFNFPTTAEFDPVATVPVLIEGGRLHLGAIIALFVVAAATVLLGRTIKGFEIRVVGAAPRAARFGGVNSHHLVLLAFAAAGALGGLAGIIEVAGPVGHLQPGISPGYGFTAIIVAFLGRLNPIGILIAGLFLALTFIGGEQAQIAMKIPLDVTKVFQGILLFYVLACDSLILYRFRLIFPSRQVRSGTG